MLQTQNKLSYPETNKVVIWIVLYYNFWHGALVLHIYMWLQSFYLVEFDTK